MNRRTKLFLAVFTAATLTGASAFAQGSGSLGQQTQREMRTAMNDLVNQGMGMPSPESLEKRVGKEKVDAFLAGAVVKLTFQPDGVYKAEAMEGGEIVSFKLGKETLTPSLDEEYDDGWLIREGEFSMPKKAQKLSLNLKKGPNEVTVDCHNKYSKSEEPVTFYVGPLDGLFCFGFTETEESEEEDAVG